MTELSREQFQIAVAAAISSVHHLYREIDRLVVGLREYLAEEPNALATMAGTSGKAGRDPSRLIMRNEYGMLFRPISDDEDEIEEDEEDDDAEDEVEDEEPAAKPKSKRPQIVAEEALLAIRVGMYDPQKGESFEPQIQYAVMQDWSVGGTQPAAGQALVMQRHMLRRIPRALGTSVGVAKRSKITTRATVMKFPGARRSKERRLACVLPLGVEVVPLYALESTEALRAVADQIKKMWADAIAIRESE